MQQVKHLLINAIACSGTFSRCIGSFGSKRGKECPPSHVRLLLNHNLGRSSPHFLKSAFTQYSLLGVKRGSSNLINYSPFRRDLDLASDSCVAGKPVLGDEITSVIGLLCGLAVNGLASPPTGDSIVHDDVAVPESRSAKCSTPISLTDFSLSTQPTTLQP
jgi:hypothetical protein